MGKGLTLKTGQTHVQPYLQPLMDLVVEAKIDPSFLITHRIGLGQGPEAYETIRDKKDGCVEVVLRPNGSTLHHQLILGRRGRPAQRQAAECVFS